MNESLKNIKAMTFDVFGTVVDWRSSVSREVSKIIKSHVPDLNTDDFADEWRAGYGPSMNKVRTGQLPWMKIDDLHRIILDDLLKEYKIDQLTEDEKVDLNHAWHRLDPWTDSVEGLTLLKQNYVISTLSNGNVSLLVNIAKYGGLP